MATIPNCPVQNGQCFLIERDRSDHPICRRFRGDCLAGGAVNIRQIILCAALLHELQYMVSFLVEAFQRIVINDKRTVPPQPGNFKPLRGIH